MRCALKVGWVGCSGLTVRGVERRVLERCCVSVVGGEERVRATLVIKKGRHTRHTHDLPAPPIEMSESDSTETETHQWLPVCALSDLDKNGRTVLRVERQRPGPPTPASTPSLVYERIFIAKGICSQAKTKEWDGGVYAITAVCPHAGAPLQAGTILDVTDLEDMVADPDRKKSWGKVRTGEEDRHLEIDDMMMDAVFCERKEGPILTTT